MRILLVVGGALVGACATDQAQYDADCTRFHVPANFVEEKQSEAASAGALAGGPLPKSVATGKVVEVNCRNEPYRVEKPGEAEAIAAEPQPL